MCLSLRFVDVEISNWICEETGLLGDARRKVCELTKLFGIHPLGTRKPNFMAMSPIGSILDSSGSPTNISAPKTHYCSANLITLFKVGKAILEKDS